MSDDNFTRSANNTGRYANMKVLGLIAVGAACVLGAYSMSSQTSSQEVFIQNDEFDFYSELELRRGSGGGYKDIKVQRVNSAIDKWWTKATQKTSFDGELSKDQAKSKLKWILGKFGKSDMYNDKLFNFAWNKYDSDKNGELNKGEF